jgi:hypothetical protein
MSWVRQPPERSARSRLHSSPRRLLALSAATAALAVAAPVSVASAAFTPIGVRGGIFQGGQANAPSGCVDSNAPSGIGDAGATVNQICGVALVFVGPGIGQAATDIGPTIIGSAVLSPVTVSSGPIAVSSLP